MTTLRKYQVRKIPHSLRVVSGLTNQTKNLAILIYHLVGKQMGCDVLTNNSKIR